MIISILSSPTENTLVFTFNPEHVEFILNTAGAEGQAVQVLRWDTEKQDTYTLRLQYGTDAAAAGV
jgi:hypothetical protein